MNKLRFDYSRLIISPGAAIPSEEELIKFEEMVNTIYQKYPSVLEEIHEDGGTFYVTSVSYDGKKYNGKLSISESLSDSLMDRGYHNLL